MEKWEINKWDKLDKENTLSEELKRPSLTFWADAFRRLRQNKLSMISLVFLIILTLCVILIPKFWPRDYDDTILEYAYIPPTLDIYDIGDNQYIYVTKDYKGILVSKSGELIEALVPINKDTTISLKYTYKIDEKSILINYGLIKEATREYNKQVARAKNDPTIDLVEAKRVLDSTPRYKLIVDDVEVTGTTNVKNQSYLLGTDSLGRDFFIRIIYGGRISLMVAIVAALVNFVIGVAYGGISGYFGGRVDNIMMRIVDTISTIPLILYVIVLMVVLEPSLGTIIIALSLTYWVGMARTVRGQVLSLKEQEFVLAAKTIGASVPRILFRHIIPNAMGPIMVSLTMQIPAAIFTEAFLSFIGLGVMEPIPSWGAIANEAYEDFLEYPYFLFYIALIMSLTLLAFNLLGDGLRDALDPRLRK
ncbi:MAG: peptide transporter permease [Haloplasmataceae bacterium]|nr:peptide transporter permease [Haloplasmataceae bacterium]